MPDTRDEDMPTDDLLRASRRLTTDTGPLEKVKRDLAVMSNDIGDIKTDLYSIRQILLGNGRGGLVERMALLEQQAGIGRYLVTAGIGIGAAVLTALLLRGIP